MKSMVRSVLFAYFSIQFSQLLVPAFYYADLKSYYAVLLGVSLLNLFLRSTLSIVSLPTKGVGYLGINFLTTGILLTFLSLLIPSFQIYQAVLSDLIIFGFVLPSKGLSTFWSGVLASLLISLGNYVLDWLCVYRK